MVVGTKAQVFHGTADRTAGGLVKSNLFQDKEDGRIKSKAQSKAGKKNPALKAWRSALEQVLNLELAHRQIGWHSLPPELTPESMRVIIAPNEQPCTSATHRRRQLPWKRPCVISAPSVGAQVSSRTGRAPPTLPRISRCLWPVSAALCGTTTKSRTARSKGSST